MIDLEQLDLDLKALDAELKEYGMSKSLRDRVKSVDFLIDVIERERQKRGLV